MLRSGYVLLAVRTIPLKQNCIGTLKYDKYNEYAWNLYEYNYNVHLPEVISTESLLTGVELEAVSDVDNLLTSTFSLE